MFASIRRHQKWLWIVIMSLTIISFVVLMDPTVSGRRGGGRGRGVLSGRDNYGTINGRSLSYEEITEALAEARLNFRLNTGRWPDEDPSSRQMFDADRQVQERLLFLELIREENIQVSDEAVADWIARTFSDREPGRFNWSLYQQFVQTVLPQAGLTEADFQQFVRHQVGVQEILSVAGLTGGLIPPREAEALYGRENEQLTTELATFSAADYLASVTVSPERLAQFFTNNLAKYRIPERVQVSYVRFDLTNHLAEADRQIAQITNLNERLDAAYRQIGPNSFRDPDGKLMTAEAAKARLKSQNRDQLARLAVQKQAQALAEEVYARYQEQKGPSNTLEQVAAEKGLAAAVTEPFSRADGPKGLKVSDTFGQAAFALSPEEPMASEPVLGEDAAYIVTFKQRFPSEVPTFDSVRTEVTADFRQQEALQAAQDAGRKAHAAITNLVAEGKTFAAACEAQKVAARKLAPFSLSTASLPDLPGRVDLGVLKDHAVVLGPGQISSFVPTWDGGFILELISRQPADPAKMKTELASYMDRLRQEQRRGALMEWFRKQMEQMRFVGLPTLAKSKPAAEPR
jgi:peptidyl-prolyl cis-trans isomerase D